MKSYLLLIDPMRSEAHHTIRETPASVKRQESGGEKTWIRAFLVVSAGRQGKQF